MQVKSYSQFSNVIIADRMVEMIIVDEIGMQKSKLICSMNNISDATTTQNLLIAYSMATN